MSNWDYQYLECRRLLVHEDFFKEPNKRRQVKSPPPLDARLDWTYFINTGIMVVWSPKGYYTQMLPGLLDMGAEGWELVAMTPPLEWSGAAPASNMNGLAANFGFVFKRPVLSDEESVLDRMTERAEESVQR
jgi:hypothetical protein